jgi:hypothetical protein
MTAGNRFLAENFDTSLEETYVYDRYIFGRTSELLVVKIYNEICEILGPFGIGIRA